MKEIQYQQAIQTLPPPLRTRAMRLPLEEQSQVEELRMRVGQPMTALLAQGERMLGRDPVQRSDLDYLLELASRNSMHRVLPKLRRGYLTLPGGHRLGLCGSAVWQGEEIQYIQPLSGANLRIARDCQGVADALLPALCREGRLVSTLILAPPGFGKTTLLRDVIRHLSDGITCQPHRVALADERGEVAALYDGVPQLSVGSRTDVMEGCPKAVGLMLLLRAMNPQVLAVDEITAPEDVAALCGAAGCGVSLLATAHGRSREELEQRELYRTILKEQIFERLVQIHMERGTRRYEVKELIPCD